MREPTIPYLSQKCKKKKKDITTCPINFENIMNNSMSANDMRWTNSEKTPHTKMYTEWTKNN